MSVVDENTYVDEVADTLAPTTFENGVTWDRDDQD